MENLFNCLCSSLLCCPSNRELFYKGEGIELMNLILREKRKKGSNSSVRVGALKVINHAMSSDRSDDTILPLCCNKFIEILGLRVLLPILMKPTSVLGSRKNEAINAIDEVEEHCLSIILALINNSKNDNKKRVINKFSELDFEKTDRLVELHFKYSDKLIKCDSQLKKERAQKLVNDEQVDEEEFFMRRLTDGGLFTLQIIDYVILLISSLYEDFCEPQKNDQATNKSKETIKSRIMKLINLHGATSVNHYKFIKDVMKNFANDKDEEEKRKLLELIEEF